MDAGTWIASVIGFLTLVLGGYGLNRSIRSTTAADQARAADRVDQQIREARADEQSRCNERVTSLTAQLAEMTTDRNTERTRANDLQALINQRGLGSGRG